MLLTQLREYVTCRLSSTVKYTTDINFIVFIVKDGLSFEIKTIIFICTSWPQSTYEIMPLRTM